MRTGASSMNSNNVSRVRRFAAMLCLSVLFLVACGGDAEETAEDTVAVSDESSTVGSAEITVTDDSAPAAAEPTAEAATESDSDPGAIAEPEEGQSPLEAALGFGNFDDEDSVVEMQRQMDRAVQSCMVNQGFEYELSTATADVFATLSPGQDLEADAYAAQYGFGISTNFDAEFGLASGQSTAPVDPNFARLEQMEPAAAAAYEAALFGQEPDIDPATGQPIDPNTGEPTDDFSIFMSGGGCFMQAQTDVLGNFQALIALEDEFVELENRIRADPRVAEIAATWSSCMAERGHTVADPVAMESALQDEYFELQAQLFSQPVDPTTTDTPELSPEFEAKLAELQDRERSLAVANFECDDNFEEQVQEISADYERAFIEENADAIAAFNGGG